MMNKFVVAGILILSLGIFASSVSALGEQTNLKTTISAEIVNTVISTYVAKILGQGFHIDSYNTSASILWITYQINLTDLNIAPILFDVDKTKLTIDGSKNSIVLTIQGLKTKVTSKMLIKGLWTANGNFTVDLAANITLSINFDNKHKNHGKSLFLIQTTQCDIDFSTFDIAVDGDFSLKVLGFIANLLKLIIKPIIPKTIAEGVQSALDGLYTTPTLIPIPLNLTQYSFLISPILNLDLNLTLGEVLKANSNNNLDIGLVGYFYAPKDIIPPLPAGSVPYHEKLDNQNIGVTIGNNVLNSLFWVANYENFIGVSINNKLLNLTVLNTDNFEFLFPSFYEYYGPNKNITVNLTNELHAVVPQIKYCSQGTINMTFQANVSFLVENPTNLDLAFVLQFDFDLALKPILSGSNISLSVENIAFDAGKQVWSKVGDLDIDDFTEMLNGTFRNIRPLINYYLAKMPFTIPGLTNGDLKIDEGYLSFAGKIALSKEIKKAIRTAINNIDTPRYKVVYKD